MNGRWIMTKIALQGRACKVQRKDPGAVESQFRRGWSGLIRPSSRLVSYSPSSTTLSPPFHPHPHPQTPSSYTAL